MDVADELCDELFRWIDQQNECADHLMALATELENMRESTTTGQLVGNTAAVLGSAVLVGTGIATFLTGGLAAPLLALSAGVTAGAGTATSVTLSLTEKWKSSSTIKQAEEKIDEIKQTQNNVERLKKELQEECERQCSKSLSSDDVQCEITARILKAMAKRTGRHLSLSQLRHLLRSDGMDIHPIIPNLDAEFFVKVTCLLSVFGLSVAYLCVKTAAKEGPKKVIPIIVTAAEEMAALSLKTALKGAGQAAGGAFGLIFSVPDLVNNIAELIKNNHQTKASKYLRTKAEEICEAVTKLEMQLKELQEMLEKIPEMECHIDLALEMFGSQIYTRGTICVEYTQTEEQDRKTQKFILLCTKDLGKTNYSSTGKNQVTKKTKSGDNKNKRQKKKATSTEDRYLDQQKKQEQEKSPDKSKTKVKEFKWNLPKILLSNVHSLSNKIEDIKKRMKDEEDINCDMMFFTETWYNDNSPLVNFSGYNHLRLDRDLQITNRSGGGGLMIGVNEAWAIDVEVEDIINTPDYELMAVSIIPHEHPENAPPLTFILVYIPPKGKKARAVNDISDFYFRAQERYGGPVFLLGDFNHRDFSHLGLEQYVTCPTRKNITLDMCYGNVPDAYTSECSTPFGGSDHKSDHNVILLNPSKDKKCEHDKTKPKKE